MDEEIADAQRRRSWQAANWQLTPHASTLSAIRNVRGGPELDTTGQMQTRQEHVYNAWLDKSNAVALRPVGPRR